MPELIKIIQRKYGDSFLYGWHVIREYNDEELNNAQLFHIRIKKTFEPAGKECGTVYDESTACKICGVGRTQIGLYIFNNPLFPKEIFQELLRVKLWHLKILLRPLKNMAFVELI